MMENSLRKKPRGKQEEKSFCIMLIVVSIDRLSVLFIPSSYPLATRDEESGVEWRNTEENVIDFVPASVYFVSID